MKKNVLKFLKKKKGFSLIELMVVVAIIGILASIAVPNYRKFQMKARQSEAKGSLSTIFSGEKSFHLEYDTYTTCLEFLGFQPEGNQIQYDVGFKTEAVPGITALPTHIAASCKQSLPVDTKVDVVASTADQKTFDAAAESNATSAFGAANADQWSIDETKALKNVVRGY